MTYVDAMPTHYPFPTQCQQVRLVLIQIESPPTPPLIPRSRFRMGWPPNVYFIRYPTLYRFLLLVTFTHYGTVTLVLESTSNDVTRNYFVLYFYFQINALQNLHSCPLLLVTVLSNWWYFLIEVNCNEQWAKNTLYIPKYCQQKGGGLGSQVQKISQILMVNCS
jgi:hypothetical protein